MNKAFIILAHENPGSVISLAETLLRDGSHVVLHYDKSAPARDVLEFSGLLSSSQGRFTLANRVDVRWGEWSIVRATLNSIERLSAAGASFDYVTLISGSCSISKPLQLLDTFLEKNRGLEFIESHDSENYRWVADGNQLERWEFFKCFNWKESPRLFNLCNRLQAGLGIRRKHPLEASPRIGSQWWTLTWATLMAVLELSRHRAVERYYRRTWIPDEHFFQTLVHHVVADKSCVSNYNLMQYGFDDWGNPRYFYDDNYCELVASNRFFARKLSPQAGKLRDRLETVVKMTTLEFAAHMVADPANEAQLPVSPTSFLEHVPAYIFAPSDLAPTGFPEAVAQPLSLVVGKYFVVLGLDSELLEQARTMLNRDHRIRCHGRLFANDAVHLEPDAMGSVDLSRFTVAARDARQLDFLKLCLRDSDSRLVGFLVNPAKDKSVRHLLPDLIADPESIVIDLADSAHDASSPLETALDLFDHEILNQSAPAVDSLLGNYTRLLQARALREKNQARSRVNFMLDQKRDRLIRVADSERQGGWLERLHGYV